MIVINTVSNERFSLNGVEYFKNFLSFVSGDNVAVYNAYDSRDGRVSAEIYSNFIVNGVTYASALLLQQALIGVIYTRDSLGAVNTVLSGSITPTSTPSGTGKTFWVATQSGTYTNFGGVVVSANSFAVISRDAAGAFSISQTTFDISSKVNVSDVINTLTSSETAKPLSAAQGKNLNEKILVNTDSLTKKADLTLGKNLFNKATITNNNYIDPNSGTINSDPLLGYSDFIPVLPSTAYININMNCAVVFYDSNKNYTTGGAWTRTFTTSSITAYVRISILMTEKDIYQLEIGTTTTTYEAYLKSISSSQMPSDVLKRTDVINNITSTSATNPVSALQAKILKEFIDLKVELVAGKNKFNKATATDGFHVDPPSGAMSVDALYCYSDFIPALPNTQYKSNSNANAVWYDSNKVAINGVYTSSSFTTSSGTAFVVVSCLVANKDVFQLEIGAASTTYEAYSQTILDYQIPSTIARTSQILDSNSIAKNICFMGDSITADPTWWTSNLLQKVSFTSFLNLARSGCTWSHLSGTVYDIVSNGGSTTADNVIWNQVNKLIDKVTNALTPIPDVVVILCGTNDLGRTLGTASSAFTASYPITGNAPGTVLDISTAIRYSCELLLTNYPNCQIIFTTPIQKGVEDNSSIFAIGQTIKDNAAMLAIPVIDLGKELGIYGKKEVANDVFLYDNLHPNAAGNEKIGSFMARRLRNIINI